MVVLGQEPMERGRRTGVVTSGLTGCRKEKAESRVVMELRPASSVFE
jgi:hypothetical protein